MAKPAPLGVHLGFEVGTGEPVSVPLGHMVITGQTQLSGKTTTLEALIARSGRAAIAFVTKRGEGSFGGGRSLPPYFRERADWQFVASVVEAQLAEKMKFERAWIIRACKGAKSLRDVRKNLDRLMAKAREGLNHDVYMLLGEYLDLVLPLLAKLPTSPTIDLRPGLNVMDLRAWPPEVQGLVIRSALEWIHEKEDDVLSVIPEAWKFMPRGRSSPVKLAAVPIAREGAGVGNFLWIDLQDLAGADYEVMRGASVWLLGVQRERNEVKRALEQIPGGFKKPKPEDVTSLHKGHFIACAPAGVRRVYVQPVWLDAETARRVATGDEPMIPAPPPRTKVVIEAIDYRFQPPRLEYDVPETNDEEDEMASEDVKRMDAKIDKLTAGIERLVKILEQPPRLTVEPTKVDLDALRKMPPGKVGASPRPLMNDFDPIGKFNEEELVDRVIARILEKAPAVLSLLVEKPEIELRTTRTKIEVDGTSTRGQVAQLIVDGFFEAGRKNADVVGELRRRGKPTHGSNVLRELRALAEIGFFTMEPGDRFKATNEARVNVVEA